MSSRHTARRAAPPPLPTASKGTRRAVEGHMRDMMEYMRNMESVVTLRLVVSESTRRCGPSTHAHKTRTRI